MNPDGVIVRGTNNGPGRCAVKSRIDMNRCFPRGFTAQYNSRNYTGPNPLGAQEAVALKEFIEKINRTADELVVIDGHGWLVCTYGDSSIAQYFTKQFGFSHNGPSGGGYFSYWAQGLPRTRGLLLEYPDTYSYGEVISRNYIGKTFNAIINILKNNPNGKAEDINTNSSTSKWEKKDNKWYYYENGNMVTGWKLVDGKWYYLESNGVMAIGWKELGGIWYYLNESGAMVKGWQTISGKTYYFNDSGHMLLGKQIIDGKSYEFNGSGQLISDTGDISLSESTYIATGEVIDVQTILNVRKGPGTNYDSIGKLNQGDKISIVAKNGEWYKILYEDDFGYAYYKYLKRFDISNKDNFISEKIQIGSIEISEKELINGNVYASINQMLRGFSNNNGYIKAVSGDIIISIQNFHEKREVSKTLPFSKCKHINGEYYYDLDEFINILGYHKYTNYIYDNNDVLYKYVNIGKSDEVEFTIHEYLDILGFVPVVGDALDAINSVIYVFEGDYVNSLLSLGAVVPIYGSAFVKGGKIGFKIIKAFSKNSDKAKKAAKLLEVKDSDFILKNIDKVTLDKISQKIVTRVYKVGDKTLNEKQFAALRASAVNKAWKQEVILVEKTGRGTRAWTESEIKELLKNKKVKGYEGHHMKSAKEFPEYAGDPDNIQFLKGRFSDINNHIDAHNGSYRNPTNGYFDPETGVRIDFGDYVPGRD